MKIFIFTGSLEIGGAEHQALLFTQYLLKKERDVELITIFPHGKYWDYAIENQLPVSSLLSEKSGSLIKKVGNLLSVIFKLRNKAKSDEEVIIYSYSDYCNLFAAISTLFKKKVKLIWGVRRSQVGGLSSSEWKIYIAEKICGLFSNQADAILYNSNAAMQHYQEKFAFSRANSYVVHNFVDVAKFSKYRPTITREALGLNPTATIVGVFGRIVDGKGHDHFLRAFQILKQKHINLQALILGPADKTLLHELKSLATNLNLQNEVVFLEARNDMPNMYNLVDLLCSPSLSEGTSNVILEAMASELPCVVTDVGDSKYIVGEKNIVVPPGDNKKLAEGLEALLIMQSAWPEIGRLNRQRMIEYFSEGKNFAKAEKILVET